MTTITDLFNRANENPITTPWVFIQNTGIQISSNAVVGNDFSGNLNAIVYSASVTSFNPNQESSILIGNLGLFDYLSTVVRGTAGGNYYHAQYDQGNTTVKISKVVSGVESLLTSFGSITLTVADVLKLKVQTVSGNAVLSIYKNGIQVGTDYNDNSAPLTTGQPGLAYALGNTGVSTIDSWIGADLTQSVTKFTTTSSSSTSSSLSARG